MTTAPTNCTKGQGQGPRGEDECMVCFDPILALTATLMHDACQNTFCRGCLNNVATTSARCPACRGHIGTARQPPALSPRQIFLDLQVEAELARHNASDVVTALERLQQQRGNQWIAARQAVLIPGLRSAFESRNEERWWRVREEILDRIDEQEDERARLGQTFQKAHPRRTRVSAAASRD